MRLFASFGRRRREAVSEESWHWALEAHPILSGLDSQEQGLLRERTERLLATRQIVPLGGAQASEELLLSVAVQASLPILHLDLGWYRGWGTLYLVAEEYRYEGTEVDEAGVVHEIRDTVSGQTMELGSVVLSVADVEASGWCDGYNVVIHEMAHVIDRQDGRIDGVPPLHRDMSLPEWQRVFTAAYSDLQDKVSAPRRRRSRRTRTPIDPYAAEAPEEFFAVTSELFFEQPHVLMREYAEVYRELARFYRQDPFLRLGGA